MLTVTEDAVVNIKAHLESNKIESAIRVAMQSSCSGVSLGLALDQEKEGDKVYNEGGLTFLVAEPILADTGAITIDFIKSSGGCCGGGGFTVKSEKPLSGGGCGGSCSSGSCGC